MVIKFNCLYQFKIHNLLTVNNINNNLKVILNFKEKIKSTGVKHLKKYLYEV